MKTYWCDGSTYMNGKEGQDSSILVLVEDRVHREHLGDYSINYAELFAVKRASEFASIGDEIRTDSLLTYKWINYPLKRTKNNRHLVPLINEIKDIFLSKDLHIQHIPREYNKAGILIDLEPFYPSTYPYPKKQIPQSSEGINNNKGYLDGL